MITFAIVHFNTPELTTCLCGSIIKNHPDAKIVIFDNSDKKPFPKDDIEIIYIDNTKGQIINFEKELSKYPNRNIDEQTRSGCNFGSAKHSMSIDWLCKNLNENFVLLDSDILLKRPIDFINENVMCLSDIIHVTGNVNRICPMLAFINVKLMNKKGISFFDGNRMHSLCNRNTLYFWYDTGASFYEDCIKNNSFMQISFDKYAIHFGNGSWRQNNKKPVNVDKMQYENIPYNVWLMKYKELWV